jgi:16S rRNA G966 N2-methylase RsmD
MSLELALYEDSPTREHWESCLVNLGTIERHVQFFIGDKILEGEGKGYITRGVYDRVAELTGIEKKTLEQYVWTCKSISSRRREELTYSFHQEVAKLTPEEQEYFLNEAVKNHWSVSRLREAIKEKEIDAAQAERDAEKQAKAPIIYNQDCSDFLTRFESKSVDLLITDPPYSTDIDDLPTFLDTWLYDAIDKVKDTGRAFICIGAYPVELYTYLGYLLETDWIVDNPLIWTYRNTLGQTPKMKYNLNYQVILHLYKETSRPLDNRITNEMFSVQDINAPDGRLGDRYHTWQKPDKLAERLITHTTKPGDRVIDPFACTGTFLLAASEYSRLAWGCDIDESAIEIAKNRGCKVGV